MLACRRELIKDHRWHLSAGGPSSADTAVAARDLLRVVSPILLAGLTCPGVAGTIVMN